MNSRLEKAKQYVKISNTISSSIGTKQEKTLHQTIKYYLTLDEAKHEISVDKKIVDVLIDDEIFEIQTQGFDKLRTKLDVLLPNHKLTVVYPVPYIKNIYLINEQGEIINNRKSPKKGSPLEIFKELYKIKSYLKNDNLNFKIIMFNSEEYRDIVVKKHIRSKGYKRNDQIVSDIVKEYNIDMNYPFIKLLDELNLPSDFTTEDVRKKGKISKKVSSLVLNILLYLEQVEKVGSKNRYIVYKRR